MKILQKLAIIMIIMVNLPANDDIYKKYVDFIVNYNIKLPKTIYDPFIVPNTPKPKVIETKKTNIVFIPKNLVLLSVLNDKALVKIDGTNIQKWVRAGDVIGDYKIKNIINSNTILVIKDKKLKIISMKQNNINIKVIK